VKSNTSESLNRRRDPAARVHLWVVLFIAAIMSIDLVYMIIEGQFLNATLILTIVVLLLVATLTPVQFSVRIPYEFQLMALVFVFAALFLGEVRSYYIRFWWWDIALHTASGLLLGIFGFLLVYVLNESESIALEMRASFVAFFAFLFAVAVGAVWEIFEFTMDSFFGTQMQKPMLGDPSGLTDTMWDLIVDSLGAGVIALRGGWYMASRRQSFVDRWIQKFIEQNPRLFRTKSARTSESQSG
jgi:hypothetical protein